MDKPWYNGKKIWYYEKNDGSMKKKSDGTIVNYSLLLYFVVRETLQ